MAWYCSFENFAFFEIIQMLHIIPEWHEHQPCFLKSSTNHPTPWVPIMCSLRTPQPICRSTSGLDVSVKGCRSICRPTYWPICRPICWPMLDRYVCQYSGRHSADTLWLSAEYQSSVGGVSADCWWSIGQLS